MMSLFVDTEFTCFELATQEIISLGIVSECGQYEFYVENTSHNADFRSDYVQRVIVPMLDYDKYGKAYDWCCLDLKEWLETLPDDNVCFIVDYVGDWHLLEPMLKAQPSSKNVHCEMYSHAFLRTLYERGVHTEAKIDDAYRELMYSDDSYYKLDPRQHHALVDAKSNRHDFIRGIKAGQ